MARSPRAPRTASSDRYPADPTTTYALATATGIRPDGSLAGELEIAACRRHLGDLDTGVNRGLRWEMDRAEHALAFPPAMLSISEGAKAGMPFELLPWHVFAVGSLFGWRKTSGRMRFRNAWLETGKGQAKALALDTPVPTPTGWTTMADLQAGDLVLDEHGVPCRVIQAHEILTDRDCYRLTFDDGATIIADAGHLWMTEMRKSGQTGHGDATRGVPIRERGRWRRSIRTTAEIATTLRYRNGGVYSANHSIALAGPLELSEADLPVSPYILGCWLGDGDADQARITIADADASETIASLSRAGALVGPRKGGKERAGRYRINIDAPMRDGLGARFKRLGLIRNKHIPQVYLRAARGQRLALLQGLMDTDGTVAAGGQCSFCNTRLELAEGVLELALSLGLKATLVTKSATLHGRKVGNSYHVNFYASGLKVFQLHRKQVRVAHSHSRRRLSADRKIVNCERVDSVPVRCISVDSPSQMFLCGRNMIPTHNSPVMASIGLYMGGFYGVKRAKVFSIGQDKRTANVLFSDAVAMCRGPIPGEYEEDEAPDTLEKLGYALIRGEGDNAWKIEFPKNDGIFQALANGEAISGPKPILVAADEIHEFKNNTSIELWKQAIAKMPGDALMLLGTNTPSTSQIVGTDYSGYFQKVVRGEIEDDEAFAFIARVDKADREKVFDTPQVWSKSLPALGITFPRENIDGMVRTAKQLLSTAMSTKRLYFGIPLGATEFWIDEETWSAVQGEFDDLALKGCRCWLSLDLSKKNDLTALSICWIDRNGHLWVKTHYWTTRDGLAERARADQAPYDQWVEKGFLEAVPGATIDKTFVAMKVKEICAVHNVDFLAFDVAGMADFEAACKEIGFPVWRWKGADEPAGNGLKLVSHAQGTQRKFEDRQLTMPTSIERLEDKILEKAVTIEDSPVTYSCAANAHVESDGQMNRAFDKKRSRGRIDGLVTIAMAVGAATMNEATAKRSFWDSDEYEPEQSDAE